MNLSIPLSLEEFNQVFANTEACEALVLKLRWPSGVCCPQCGGTTVARMRTRKLWVCHGANCHGYQFSITSQTLLHGSRKGLLCWFKAMHWYAITSKPERTLRAFKDYLGVSFHTGWMWLKKLDLAFRESRSAPGHATFSIDCTPGDVPEIACGGSPEEIKRDPVNFGEKQIQRSDLNQRGIPLSRLMPSLEILYFVLKSRPYYYGELIKRTINSLKNPPPMSTPAVRIYGGER